MKSDKNHPFNQSYKHLFPDVADLKKDPKKMVEVTISKKEDPEAEEDDSVKIIDIEDLADEAVAEVEEPEESAKKVLGFSDTELDELLDEVEFVSDEDELQAVLPPSPPANRVLEFLDNSTARMIAELMGYMEGIEMALIKHPDKKKTLDKLDSVMREGVIPYMEEAYIIIKELGDEG